MYRTPLICPDTFNLPYFSHRGHRGLLTTDSYFAILLRRGYVGQGLRRTSNTDLRRLFFVSAWCTWRELVLDASTNGFTIFYLLLTIVVEDLGRLRRPIVSRQKRLLDAVFGPQRKNSHSESRVSRYLGDISRRHIKLNTAESSHSPRRDVPILSGLT
jgi:hypothetical protein